LAFPVLTDVAALGDFGIHSVRSVGNFCLPWFTPSQPIQVRKALNDAVLLRNISDLSSMNIPLQSPNGWQQGSWLDQLALDVGLLFLDICFSTGTKKYLK